MSSTAVETVMLVCTDALNNNNKFWEGTLQANGDVHCRWGRVGATGQTKVFASAGKSFLTSKANEKRRGGYTEVAVLGSPKSQVVATTTEAVKRQISSAGNPVIEALLERLVKENRHEIFVMSGGQINVSADGVVTTAVGVIDGESVRSARQVLATIALSHATKDFNSTVFIDYLQQYLTLVPQKVSAKRGWHTTFLAADDAIIKQSAFLDQLEGSIELALANAKSSGPEPAKVFDVELELIEDGAEWTSIERFFKQSINLRHASSGLKPVRAFRVTIGSMARAFENDGMKVGNVQRLWHGTRAYNVLSILKQGLIVPKSGGSYNITGRMFGDGLYFSDQSTKSLAYSRGDWSRSQGIDNRCFMFLADVAMGRAMTPSGPNARAQYPAKGYDSTFAKGGESGVLNNEMIVYRTSQANLTTLVEFSG
ncbi:MULTISPECIES: WGR domain-containing protein [unclassified Variovorax]|uniref:WGR domain-containing protein n=1 Tax=unclassified Variovorax TaxID=663243 RepID=UPI0011AEF89C|nr:MULTISPECIES: WGR domain-containing protein [unclassified Variovorax]